MDELANTNINPHKPNPSADVASLRELVKFMNNPLVTGAVVPPEAKQEIAAAFGDKSLDAALPSSTAPSPTLAQPSQPPPQAAPSQAQLPPEGLHPRVIDIPVPLGRKLFFTGRLCAGKDFTAATIGADIFGFADPIYSLAEYLLNIKVNATEGKDTAGVRKFLQTVGQWGRNEVSEQYPHTIERSMFAMMIRSLANQNCLGSGVDWGMFGLTPDLWIDGLLRRVDAVEQAQPEDSRRILSRVVVTNCRFANEYKRLQSAGFEHWHIVCSPARWLARLRTRKLDASSAEVSDVSEQLAIDLNNNLNRKLSAGKLAGPKMRVVWCDEGAVCPSDKIYSLDEFVALANQSAYTQLASQ